MRIGQDALLPIMSLARCIQFSITNKTLLIWRNLGSVTCETKYFIAFMYLFHISLNLSISLSTISGNAKLLALRAKFIACEEFSFILS